MRCLNSQLQRCYQLLAPLIFNNNFDIKDNMSWSKQEEQELFKLHLQFGNRWAFIAMRMNREQSKIKNKFYSTLRKGFRKMNSYITNIKRKRNPSQISANKLIKPQFITKLAAIAGENFEDKYEVKAPAIALSKELQQGLCRLACSDLNYDKNDGRIYNFQQKLLEDIHLFIKNCKKRKGNKKFRLDSSNSFQKASQSDGKSIKQQQSQQQPIKIKQKMKKREMQIQQKINKNEEGEQNKNQNPFKKENILFRYEIPEEKLYQVNAEYQAKIEILFDQYAGLGGDRGENNKTPFSIISTHRSFLNMMNASPYTSDYFNFMQAFNSNTTKLQTNSMVYSKNMQSDSLTKSDSIMQRFEKLSFLQKIPIVDQSQQNVLFFQSNYSMTNKNQNEEEQQVARQRSPNKQSFSKKEIAQDDKQGSNKIKPLFNTFQIKLSSEATYSELTEPIKQKSQNDESSLKNND